MRVAYFQLLAYVVGFQLQHASGARPRLLVLLVLLLHGLSERECNEQPVQWCNGADGRWIVKKNESDQ